MEITPDGQPGDWGQVVIKIANHPLTSGGIKEFAVMGDGEVGPVRDGPGTMQGDRGPQRLAAIFRPVGSPASDWWAWQP